MKIVQNTTVINLKHLGEMEFGQTSFGYLAQFGKMLNLKILHSALFLTSSFVISLVNQEVP